MFPKMLNKCFEGFGLKKTVLGQSGRSWVKMDGLRSKWTVQKTLSESGPKWTVFEVDDRAKVDGLSKRGRS